MQVMFVKFAKRNNAEEEKVDERALFSEITSLLQNGQFEGEDAETLKHTEVLAEDIYIAMINKFLSMDFAQVESNMGDFLGAWIESGTVKNDGWKAIARKSITEMENYVTEIQKLPEMTAKSLILPLLKKNSIQLGDLSWYEEEYKDDLFEVAPNYQIGGLVLAGLAADGQKTKEQLASDF